jgi:glucans biosynthesis protein C
MNTAQPVEPRERLHGLDAVRGIALLLGVVFHATLSFLPGMQIWVTVDSSRSEILSVLFYVLHMFRMLTFFLIAGFFARMSLERLGIKNFAFDRLKRITLPLVVAWLPIFMAIVAVSIWSATIANGGTPPPPSPQPGLNASNFPLTHLWFLYVLLIFYMVFVVLHVAFHKNTLLSRVGKSIVQIMFGWGGFVLIALPMISSLYLNPSWLMWFGIPTPDTGLLPNATALVVYGSAFGLGWLLNTQPELLHNLKQRWVLYLVVAVIGTISSLAMVGTTPVLMPAAQNTTKLAYAVLYSLAAWSWAFALIGMSLRFLGDFSPTRRYIADASYWIYLVHLPLIMALQTLVGKLEWSWVLKFPLVLLIAFAILFSSYQLLVRYSFIGIILNGKRAKRQQRIPDAKTSSLKV